MYLINLLYQDPSCLVFDVGRKRGGCCSGLESCVRHWPHSSSFPPSAPSTAVFRMSRRRACLALPSPLPFYASPPLPLSKRAGEARGPSYPKGRMASALPNRPVPSRHTVLCHPANGMPALSGGARQALNGQGTTGPLMLLCGARCRGRRCPCCHVLSSWAKRSSPQVQRGSDMRRPLLFFFLSPLEPLHADAHAAVVGPRVPVQHGCDG